MTDVVYERFEPKNLPDDWRDDSLRRAAVWINRDEDIPAIFPEDSLAYLWDLAYGLPRCGILFIKAARDFISDLAIRTLPEPDAETVRRILNLQERKLVALAHGDYETALACRQQQGEHRARLSKSPIHQVTRDEIRHGLLRVGVDPVAGPIDCGSGM